MVNITKAGFNVYFQKCPYTENEASELHICVKGALQITKSYYSRLKLPSSNSGRRTLNRRGELATFDPRKYKQCLADHRCHPVGRPLATIFHSSLWLPTRRALPTSILRSITLNRILDPKRVLVGSLGFWSATIKHTPSPAGVFAPVADTNRKSETECQKWNVKGAHVHSEPL